MDHTFFLNQVCAAQSMLGTAHESLPYMYASSEACVIAQVLYPWPRLFTSWSYMYMLTVQLNHRGRINSFLHGPPWLNTGQCSTVHWEPCVNCNLQQHTVTNSCVVWQDTGNWIFTLLYVVRGHNLHWGLSQWALCMITGSQALYFQGSEDYMYTSLEIFQSQFSIAIVLKISQIIDIIILNSDN